MSDRALTPYRIFARRHAAGVAGMITSAWVAGVVVYALVATYPFPRIISPLPGLLFLCSWLIGFLAYTTAFTFAGTSFKRRLCRELSANTSPTDNNEDAPPSIIVEAMAKIAVARAAERRANTWPMIMLGLLLPMTLHYLLLCVLFHGRERGSELGPAYLSAFSAWIGAGMMIAGHCHLLLVGLAWRYGKRLAATPTQFFDATTQGIGVRVWLLASVSAVFCGIPLVLIDVFRIRGGEVVLIVAMITLLTMVTALPFLYFYSRLQKKLLSERFALDRALLGQDEEGFDARLGRLAAIAAWKSGPKAMRLLSLDALVEHGQGMQTRRLVDLLLPREEPAIRLKLLSISSELSHRPPLEVLLPILDGGSDPTSMRLTCELLEMSRDQRAEPSLIRALSDPDDHVVAAAADALARCGTITAVEALSAVAGGVLRRGKAAAAARSAIEQIQARLDSRRARGELSVVAASDEGALSVAREEGALSVTETRS